LTLTWLAFLQARAADLGLQTLSEFGFNPKNPQGGLAQGNDGNLYGTTAFGGTSGENGTVFKMTSDGTLDSLFSFNGTNGSHPLASLLLANDGNFYGTTAFGGSNANNGTVFRITPSGTFTLLYFFKGSDGSSPMGGLVQGTDGSLYGTTSTGGASGATNGTVFKITLGGLFTSLLTFPSNGRSGRAPMGNLVQGSDGSFYGTTSAGGTSENGTVFKITPTGTFSSLVSFSGLNGSFPAAGLVRGSDGNFYGTTQFGGAHDDNGTVFKVTPSGVLTSLFSFSGPDGNYPVAALVTGPEGNFYGTTSGDRSFGGANTFGTAFRITPAGALGTLVFFQGTNGACPVAGLTRGGDTNFYGTTFQGGAGSGGTVFRLVAPPRISAIRAAGGNVTLTWSSFTNGTYRVEYKSALTAPSWTALSPDVRATTGQTSITNNPQGATLRFYRVSLQP